jgi:hypothetical protein
MAYLAAILTNGQQTMNNEFKSAAQKRRRVGDEKH